jgi:RNase H-like domain found in reverse transcriptase/Reverse transcriptase (RNA-dependent DNA polymerase)
LNPYPTEVELRQDAEIGKAERVERVVSVIAEKEYADESLNLNRVRRVTVKGKEESIPEHSFPVAPRDQVPNHLLGLYEKAIEGRSEYESSVVAGLLSKYGDTFSKDEWDLGVTNLAEHPINTGDAAPIKQRPRRVPLAYAEEEKRAVEDLLKKGVIQKSTSPWASPIVLVKKKSGAIRPCVDYRKVNALVKQDGFPLPRVQDCLDAVAGSSIFSSFDLTSGYFQIPLKREDIPKSAFVCKFGQYEMTKMPFGLNNSASTFQRTMELALQGLQWETCLVYIDDIIVYATTFEQHIARVSQVLERIKQAGLKLRPDKCQMLQTEVVFLGHVVSKDGVKPDPTNISKIIGWPRPQTTKQVKQFVATGSYYRRFVKDFAKIARPLNELTKKGKEFQWSDECEKSFNMLKEILTSPNIMGYPINEGGQFILDVDASGTGIGSVLAQLQGGRERVIAYASRSLNKAERNYCITEKELLAAVYFIQYHRQYLLGRKFLVHTDHQA